VIHKSIEVYLLTQAIISLHQPVPEIQLLSLLVHQPGNLLLIPFHILTRVR